LIHLDSVIFYSIGAAICFVMAEIIRPKPVNDDVFNLKPGQMMVPTSWKQDDHETHSKLRQAYEEKWKKAALETIELAKEMQKPRTIAVINDKNTPRKARRVSKRTNTPLKKRNQAKRSANSKPRKGTRVLTEYEQAAAKHKRNQRVRY